MATLRLSRGQNQARLNYAEAEQGRPKVNLPLRSVILSVTKDLKACTTFIGRANWEILHFVQNDTLFCLSISSLRGLAQAVAIFHFPLHLHKGRSPRRFAPRDDVVS